jgi:DNA-binding winged helix-turn-helix (wHTH) protein
MIALRLLSHRPDRREWLEAVLNADPELKVIASGADIDDIAHLISRGANVIVIDLAHPHAVESRFWSALHVYFTGARLMALVDAPIDPAGLEAALHAGAYYMVEWTEPVERLLRAARAAGTGEGFIPVGNVIHAIADYFLAAGLPMRKVRIGHVNVDPQQCAIKQGMKVIPLTSLELDLLVYLAPNAGRPVPTSELLQTVWHRAPQSAHLHGQIKSTVKRLRQKLEPEPSRPRYLLNRHGHGYYVPKSAVE